MSLHGRSLFRAAIGIVILGAVVGLYLSPFRSWLTVAHVREALAQVRTVWWGPIVFIFCYALGAVLFVPASIFIIAAGLIWGWMLGGSYSLIGGGIGAAASFIVAEYVGGGFIAKLGRRGEAVAKRLENANFTSLFLLRVIPLFPFGVINYGAGFARIRFRDFLLSTVLGIAGPTFVFAYSADALVNGTLTKGEALQRLLIVGGLIAVMVIVPTLLKRRLAKELHIEE